MGISEGDTVSVHYKGSLEDGQVFDTSEGRGPLEFQVGAGQVIPGFEKAVVGKDVGDKTQATVPPEDAYGERNPEMVRELPKEQLGAQDLEVGQVLGLQDDQGRQFQATVAEMNDESVTLDFNHFLAGQTLLFDIEVVDVQSS